MAEILEDFAVQTSGCGVAESSSPGEPLVSLPE